MKYRKKPVEVGEKPVEVEAVQFISEEFDLFIATFPEVEFWTVKWSIEDGWCLSIPTLEGVMKASDGDFIIRGVKGEFYPCKPDIFAATYEAVPSEDPQTEAMRYRKKPVEVEAVQFLGMDFGPILKAFPEAESWISSYLDRSGWSVWIPALQREVKIGYGDFVIRGSEGEFYSCKPDIFKATYDEVPQGDQQTER